MLSARRALIPLSIVVLALGSGCGRHRARGGAATPEQAAPTPLAQGKIASERDPDARAWLEREDGCLRALAVDQCRVQNQATLVAELRSRATAQTDVAVARANSGAADCIEASTRNAQVAYVPFETIKWCLDQKQSSVDAAAREAQERHDAYTKASEAGTVPVWIAYIEKYRDDSYTPSVVDWLLKSSVSMPEADRAQLEEQLVAAYPGALAMLPVDRRVLLVGPRGLRVADLVKLKKAKKSNAILVARVRASTEPYKLFDDAELAELSKLGLSDDVVAAMIEVTTKLRDQRGSLPQPAPLPAAAAAGTATATAPAAGQPAPPAGAVTTTETLVDVNGRKVVQSQQSAAGTTTTTLDGQQQTLTHTVTNADGTTTTTVDAQNPSATYSSQSADGRERTDAAVGQQGASYQSQVNCSQDPTNQVCQENTNVNLSGGGLSASYKKVEVNKLEGEYKDPYEKRVGLSLTTVTGDPGATLFGLNIAVQGALGKLPGAEGGTFFGFGGGLTGTFSYGSMGGDIDGSMLQAVVNVPLGIQYYSFGAQDPATLEQSGFGVFAGYSLGFALTSTSITVGDQTIDSEDKSFAHGPRITLSFPTYNAGTSEMSGFGVSGMIVPLDGVTLVMLGAEWFWGGSSPVSEEPAASPPPAASPAPVAPAPVVSPVPVAPAAR